MDIGLFTEYALGLEALLASLMNLEEVVMVKGLTIPLSYHELVCFHRVMLLIILASLLS